ncbi:probable G-protein coupled receptor 148 [Pseudoliparis swirei]|uniref:probable G-protein coupled receptor 148 n=1 Tax=Pseudoliparis swirei TaxID=2059687 RepID=UPI0024BDADFF|nr:probable G-protein coupled receptor 148 [Pseudoliparis swirei]XP_056277296.1 probable G-protein coupled receptor 148 [Pseudoliparis swirei]XP_056277297.1 probable G-protein coupled receptor 148 [Pseudoliparis swirei]
MPSSTLISNLTQEWVESLLRWKLHYFVIPTTVVTLATLVANPVLLSCIFLSRSLRQETRYLLVANTLAADILFLVFNLAVVICNAVRAQIPWLLCELITAVIVTAYTCAIFTITLMVVDTYAAVRWPLRYHEVLPPERTHCILLGAWVLAAMYPLVLVIIRVVKGEHSQNNGAVCLALISLGFFQVKNIRGVRSHFIVWALICAALIFFCYIRLYMVTRTQGIWHSRFSRARVTLLAHGVLLLLYFTPGLVFILELFLFQAEEISQDLRVWINTVNMCVFMLLPRAVAPYLYGLRYREISVTLMMLLHQHSRHTVS